MLQKLLILLLLSIYSITNVIGQETQFLMEDTAIFLDELTFNSSKEKSLFRAIYQNRSEDYFSLIFMVKKAIYGSDIKIAKAKLLKKIVSFKHRKLKEKEAKGVKTIYKEIHSDFLKEYALKNHFNEVFEKGNYNCLSASFLYGYVLEELDIPYQINLLPNHVNLTTYPKTHKIILETTDPISGYFSYNIKFKELYVANLVTYNLINKVEKKGSQLTACLKNIIILIKK